MRPSTLRMGSLGAGTVQRGRRKGRSLSANIHGSLYGRGCALEHTPHHVKSDWTQRPQAASS
jgi:hypothetical protein